MLLAVAALLGTQVRAADEVILDHPVRRLQSGRQFRSELTSPLTASWRNVPVRTILKRISEDRKVAILLDRRIDPTQEVTIDIKNTGVEEAVRQVAALVSAQTSVAGSTLYVGPAAAAARLRTLMAIRTQELDETSSLAKSRRFDLAKRRTLHWNDLDRPIDLIGHIAERYELRVGGIETIPHDLWAGATLPNVNAVEALSLVLIQFDRSFTWTDSAAGILVIPIPSEVSVNRSYSTGTRNTSEILRVLRDQVADLQARAQGRRIEIRGTIEQHEMVAELLQGGKKASRPTTSTKQKPLRSQSFTLKVQNAPVSSLMKRLEQIGVEFEYDRTEMMAAGIDFDQKISFQVSKAPANDFFKRVFDPLGITFRITGWKVSLRPR